MPRAPDPPPPTDEPGDAWALDDASAEGDFVPDPGVPDDPPDAPLPVDDFAEPELDLLAPDDAENTTWTPDPPAEEDMPWIVDPTDAILLSWREIARLPDHGVEVPAILDPTVASSTWTVPAHVPVRRLDILVEIGAFRAQVDVEVREGRTAELRLGRDALTGKVLIRP